MSEAILIIKNYNESIRQTAKTLGAANQQSGTFLKRRNALGQSKRPERPHNKVHDDRGTSMAEKNNIKHLTKSRTLKVIGVFFVKVYDQHKCKCREFTTSH